MSLLLLPEASRDRRVGPKSGRRNRAACSRERERERPSLLAALWCCPAADRRHPVLLTRGMCLRDRPSHHWREEAEVHVDRKEDVDPAEPDHLRPVAAHRPSGSRGAPRHEAAAAEERDGEEGRRSGEEAGVHGDGLQLPECQVRPLAMGSIRPRLHEEPTHSWSGGAVACREV